MHDNLVSKEIIDWFPQSDFIDFGHIPGMIYDLQEYSSSQSYNFKDFEYEIKIITSPDDL